MSEALSVIVPGQNILDDSPDTMVFKRTVEDGKEVLTPVQKTSEFRLKFRPWRVTLMIYPEAQPKKIYEVFYHVRAGNPHDAVAIAEKFFQEWEKSKFAPYDLYPDTVGVSAAECIDEQDWFALWKESQKHKVVDFFGDKANPQVFRSYHTRYPAVWAPFIDRLRRMRRRSFDK